MDVYPFELGNLVKKIVFVLSLYLTTIFLTMILNFLVKQEYST